MALSLVTLVAVTPQGAEATTWRVGDSDQPWRVYPVSFMLTAGEVYRPDYILGGAHAIEIIVDDDGDGLVDEDPVDVVDADGDGLFNEDPADGIANARRFFSVRSATYEVTVQANAGKLSRTLVAVLSRASPTDIKILYTYWK